MQNVCPAAVVVISRFELEYDLPLEAKRWKCREQGVALQLELARGLGIDSVLA